jgi:hypothetical protein
VSYQPSTRPSIHTELTKIFLDSNQNDSTGYNPAINDRNNNFSTTHKDTRNIDGSHNSSINNSNRTQNYIPNSNNLNNDRNTNNKNDNYNVDYNNNHLNIKSNNNDSNTDGVSNSTKAQFQKNRLTLEAIETVMGGGGLGEYMNLCICSNDCVYMHIKIGASMIIHIRYLCGLYWSSRQLS